MWLEHCSFKPDLPGSHQHQSAARDPGQDTSPLRFLWGRVDIWCLKLWHGLNTLMKPATTVSEFLALRLLLQPTNYIVLWEEASNVESF